MHSKQSSGASRDSLFHSDENYSNPIDSLKATAVVNDTNHNITPPRPSKQHLNRSPPRFVLNKRLFIRCQFNK